MAEKPQHFARHLIRAYQNDLAPSAQALQRHRAPPLEVKITAVFDERTYRFALAAIGPMVEVNLLNWRCSTQWIVADVAVRYHCGHVLGHVYLRVPANPISA